MVKPICFAAWRSRRWCRAAGNRTSSSGRPSACLKTSSLDQSRLPTSEVQHQCSGVGSLLIGLFKLTDVCVGRCFVLGNSWREDREARRTKNPHSDQTWKTALWWGKMHKVACFTGLSWGDVRLVGSSVILFFHLVKCHWGLASIFHLCVSL